MMISSISPCLWFNGEAEDAAKFYVSIFPDSRIDSVSRYDGGTRLPVSFPKGTALMVEFTLAGQRFQALNGGPQFKHSEAISLKAPDLRPAGRRSLYVRLAHSLSGLLESR